MLRTQRGNPRLPCSNRELILHNSFEAVPLRWQRLWLSVCHMPTVPSYRPNRIIHIPIHMLWKNMRMRESVLKSPWESSEPVTQPAERVYGRTSLRFKTAKSITNTHCGDYTERGKSAVPQAIMPG